MGVEIAGAGRGVEGGTRLVVAVVFEGGEGIGVVAEDAGGRVAREGWRQAFKRVGNPLVDAGGAFWIGVFEVSHARTEAGSVELGDLEDTDTTLRATDAAGEPGAAFLDGAGEFGVDDLDEMLVTGR